jgi:NRAMP (natural resistance-associated macrophage protein)-like metal ion transporter
MTEEQNDNVNKITPGMDVEVTKGDLGESDISKPKVKDVVQDQQGNVKEVVVSKGALFKKKLAVPADRIASIDAETQDDKSPGKVTIATNKGEIKGLKAVGEEQLTDENQDGLLEEVQKTIPTTEAIREMEARNLAKQEKREHFQEVEEKEDENLADQQTSKQSGIRSKLSQLFHVIGPGFLSGMAGNDATAVTTYAIDGATAGNGHLWLMLLSTPMYQAVQFSCAKIGRITQKGLSEILREHYSRWMALLASIVLIIADIALIAGNLVAIGSGLELLTGLSWVWFVIPVAVALWYITVFRSFDIIKKVFIVMSLAFVTYIITAIFSHADWGAVLFRTFVPQVNFSFADISAAVALLGATISPYSMFWQVQEEKEQKRVGTPKQRMRSATLDVASGVIGGNLVSYFIIITTATTLFTHHQSINTAADAAQALGPLVGPFAKYLFAIGLIGAGLISIPVMLASTSYSIAGTFGWPAGLSKKPWQSEGFYLILTVALVASLALALLRFNPIQLIFWANILVGILAPVLVVYVIMVANNRKIMRNQPVGLLTNFFLVLTAVILVAAAALFFYGLATGKGS